MIHLKLAADWSKNQDHLWAPVQRRTDSTLIKALARAFRWKRMLESGEFTTINELAEREGIAPSYMTRILRLTLLAPDIVEAILDGRQGPEVTFARLLKGFSVEWERQNSDFQRYGSFGDQHSFAMKQRAQHVPTGASTTKSIGS